MRKSFILILILILLFQSSIVFALTYNSLNTSINNFEEYKTNEFLDSSLPYTITDNKGNTHRFNKEIWEELGLVVYGDYSSIYSKETREPSPL